MIDLMPFFRQWFLAILEIPAQAAAGLPLIILLGLFAGRRGRAAFCLEGNLKLLRFGLILAFIAPGYYFLAYLFQIFTLRQSGGSLFAPLFSVAGLPWLTCILCSCAGFGAMLLAARNLSAILRAVQPAGDRYKIRALRSCLLPCCVALIFFFACFWLIRWPFAGLPDGLPMDRAVMAIGRNAVRNYFLALCPAGALGLVMSCHTHFETPELALLARRWLAAWAAGASFPHALLALGMILGLALRGNLAGNLASGYLAQTVANGALALAIICWLILVFGKTRGLWLAWSGVILLVLRASAPYVIKLAQQG